ncbi:hypothetical protein FHR32_003101 [Streptosporangium album]|uniref:Uncharacterized protein n=1 Tax=Streptosporangium album TaxID=47479 RepID=A0A7W7RV35_9ACTN|nr:hypothetical protein [Streptosporangium album]MBB4938796.1 hypothetical protein [Streptosporangium album]
MTDSTKSGRSGPIAARPGKRERLVAAYQGISLLTDTFRDPDLMTSQIRRLEEWIDQQVDDEQP